MGRIFTGAFMIVLGVWLFRGVELIRDLSSFYAGGMAIASTLCAIGVVIIFARPSGPSKEKDD